MTPTGGSAAGPDRIRRRRRAGLAVLTVLAVAAVLLAGLGTGVLLPAAGWPLLGALSLLVFWLQPSSYRLVDRWPDRGARLAFLTGFAPLLGTLFFGSAGLGPTVFSALVFAVPMTVAYEAVQAGAYRLALRRRLPPGAPGSRVPPLPTDTRRTS